MEDKTTSENFIIFKKLSVGTNYIEFPFDIKLTQDQMVSEKAILFYIIKQLVDALPKEKKEKKICEHQQRLVNQGVHWCDKQKDNYPDCENCSDYSPVPDATVSCTSTNVSENVHELSLVPDIVSFEDLLKAYNKIDNLCCLNASRYQKDFFQDYDGTDEDICKDMYEMIDCLEMVKSVIDEYCRMLVKTEVDKQAEEEREKHEKTKL